MPGGPRKTTLSLAVTKSSGAQVRDQVAFEAAGVVEVELLEGLAGREPGGADPTFAAVGLPGGDLALQAGDEEFLVGPGLGAGPFGQAGHRLAQRRGLQRPGQERDLGRCRSRVAGAGRRWPSRDPAVDAERGVVVGQRPELHLGLGARPDQPDPVPAQQRAAATCSGSVIVWCLAQTRSWSATTRPRRTPAPGPGQRRPRPGDRSPPGAPSSRCCPTGRSGHGATGRGAPPGRRCHRRQRDHRGPVRGDPITRGAAQRPPRSVFTRASHSPQLKLKSAGEVNVRPGRKRASPGSRARVRPDPSPPDRPACRPSPSRPTCRGTPGTLGQLRPAAPIPPDGALTVPDQQPRHRTEPADQPPPARRTSPPRIATGSAAPTATSSTRSPSSAPAAPSRFGTARTRPAPRSAGNHRSVKS